MNTNYYEITDGYVSSLLGRTYKTVTDKTLAEIIRLAAGFNQKSETEITTLLENSQSVQWCKSPNFYYDHSYGIIRRKRITAPPATVK